MNVKTVVRGLGSLVLRMRFWDGDGSLPSSLGWPPSTPVSKLRMRNLKSPKPFSMSKNTLT